MIPIGSEDFPGLVHAIGSAGDRLDDAAENAIAEIRVGVFRAGGPVERLLHRVADEGRGPDRERDPKRPRDLLGRGGAHRIERFVAVPAGGVLEALMDRDAVDARVHAGAGLEEWRKLDDRENLVVEPELSLLHELEHRRRGKRLGDRGDPKQRGRLNQFLSLDVGVAEATRIHQAAILAHRQGGAGRPVFAHEIGHKVVVGGRPRVTVSGDRKGDLPGRRGGDRPTG